MASEIRVNKINNRAGLGTITIADTGVVVNGIVTCTEVSGLNVLNIAGVSTFASTLDINGDIDVDGHTNLDNVSIAGLSTHSEGIFVPDSKKALFGNVASNGDLEIYHSGSHSYIQNKTNFLFIHSNSLALRSLSQETFVDCSLNGSVDLYFDSVKKFETSLKGIQVGTGVTIETNGQATFTGIVTASSFRGDGSQLTGVTSVGGDTGVDFNDNIKVRLGTGNDLEIYYDGTDGWIKNVGKLKLESTNDQIELRADIIYLRNKAANQNYFYGVNNAFVGLTYAGDMRLETESTGIKFRKRLDPETDSTVDLGTNAKRWRNIYADTYYGDGANLTNLPAGAPVGGASTNTVFFENDKAVAVNYQVTSTKNAMSAGPIAINAGIAVTVPSGCAWTIV